MSEIMSLILCVLATVIYVIAKRIGLGGTKEGFILTLIMWILHIVMWNIL